MATKSAQKSAPKSVRAPKSSADIAKKAAAALAKAAKLYEKAALAAFKAKDMDSARRYMDNAEAARAFAVEKANP